MASGQPKKRSRAASSSVRTEGEEEMYNGFGEPRAVTDAAKAKADAKALSEDDHEYEGEPIDVTWGREHVQPVQYNGMDIGPFSMTTKIRKGETPVSAAARAMLQLDAIAQNEFKTKLPAFLQRIRDAAGN